LKYDAHHINIILEALADGEGRVRACKKANITHDTFMNWLNEYSEFSDSVKKAEDKGNDRIKDLAKRGIIEKFGTTWQAAAWWLERNFPDEFKNKVEQSGEIQHTITFKIIE